MLAAPAYGLQRLRGEDEEAAGEERNHRQHVEVHPVRARRISARLLEVLDGAGVHARRQQSLDVGKRALPGRMGFEADVEAVQLAEPLEAPLRSGDIDERRLPAQGRGWQDRGDLQRNNLLANQQLERVPLAEAKAGGRAGGEK